jgi:hypothetical protein
MVSKSKKSSKNNNVYTLSYMFAYIHAQLQYLNTSKVFAGLVVITLNIASRFVSINLSKTMESYLKHTFSRDILIFCIVWMGSRDIYIATLVTIVFVLCMDYFLNEESAICILPESFKTHHMDLMDNKPPTPEEVQQAKQTLERAAQSEQNNVSKSNAPISNDSSTIMVKW